MTKSKNLILSSLQQTLSKLSDKQRLPSIPVWGESTLDTISRFRFEWERNGGDWFEFGNREINDKQTFVSYLRNDLHVQSAWVADEPICRLPIQDVVTEIQIGDSAEDSFQSKCDLGVAGCELLLSETGSIAEASRKGRPRALTLLPPNVLFVVHASQFVANLEDALKHLSIHSPHGWVWITGPSRTADIEKVLIKGVHGPKRVAVLLIHDETKESQ